jgi:hypothetical protein
VGSSSEIERLYRVGSTALAWSGSGYAAAWYDWFQDIYARTISAAGSPLGTTIPVTDDSEPSDEPSLAWTGSEFGLAWKDGVDGNDEIYFVRLRAGGSLSGPLVRVTSDGATSRSPTLVWTGSEYGLSWSDHRDGNGEIYLTRLSTTGAVSGTLQRITSEPGDSDEPDLVWTGSEYGLAWQDERSGYFEIHFARLDGSGSMIGSERRVTSSPHRSVRPSLVWTGSEYALAWVDNREGPYDLYFTRISSSGVEQGDDERLTTSGVQGLEGPSLVWTGSEYGIVYVAPTSGYEGYFMRFGLCE